MCGIVGIVANTAVNQSIYDALTYLQHRGQDAAGIMTCHNGRMILHKSNGLVRDVFHTRHMLHLLGCMGIGHVRYPTAGSASQAEAQPFFVNSPYGIALAHNGNLINDDALRTNLFHEDLRHINTDSDSEVLLNVFANELQKRGNLIVTDQDVFAAVAGVHRRCLGAYAAVAMIAGCGIVAFRDAWGIRPLVYGLRETAQGVDYMVASESVALDGQGFTLIDDVKPGEAVFISMEGRLSVSQCAEQPRYAPCIFEHVYLARPDSIMDKVSVYKARLRMGEKLADKIKRLRPDHDIDVVMPIPDTSRTAALQLATKLGCKYREGFIKNRYIGRTFIMPGQQERKKSVRQKLNPIGLEFKGKNVLLVDDSIVRGTTSQQIVRLAREAGATRVYFASAAPPVRFPNIYGIDMPTSNELIAHGCSVEEISTALGVDWLVYQDLEDLIEAVQKGNREITSFDCSVFTGEYVTGGVSDSYFAGLAQRRSDLVKTMRRSTDQDISDM
ncbi:MAG: amidophosphoribosyltransferase [Proteobacteria bacterium]|nr:amidophosphoribosyltransferase [Pseudomonadota bacterium]MBU4294560.1 amidophosphoribosyltransferase [Pseudomonadota bacterium]MCG2747096.1 amidophosphoribosyltransferase [Desulfobulbaceae bacterium]